MTRNRGITPSALATLTVDVGIRDMITVMITVMIIITIISTIMIIMGIIMNTVDVAVRRGSNVWS